MLKICVCLNLLFASFLCAQELFDPEQVAKEEVAAWKDYYADDILGLTQHLSHLAIVEFRINKLTAWTTVIPQLTEAAKLFKELPHSTTQETYDTTVLPHLTKAYSAIKESLKGTWDPREAAKDELDWWIYRRENEAQDPEIVGKKIADLYRLIYGAQDENHFGRAGYLRAIAGKYRDMCQQLWHHVEETDWTIIEGLLEKSYEEVVMGIKANKNELK
jgi:hypothetical protein